METKDELGKRSLAIIFAFMNGKKAPPGFSRHTHGIAADLTTKEKGKEWVVNSNYGHQVGWQRTWLYQWLVDHAWEYDLYQLKTETWQREYHPETDHPEGCWAGKVKVQDRPVPKPK